MKIMIEFSNPSKRGMFDEIVLSYISKGIKYSTNIVFQFGKLFQFAKDEDSVAFDFLLLSVIIYNVDRFINRKKYSTNGWNRIISIPELPVKNPDIFNRSSNKINTCIGFLTGDDWDIKFTKLGDINFKQSRENESITYDKDNIDKVCLFSGGLDSLIGVLDILESTERRILLSSHKDLGKEGNDQIRLLNKLNSKYENRIINIQSKVGLGHKEIDSSEDKEMTFRSRSLLFLSQAIYLANSISKDIVVVIPENGSITVNIPLTKSRRSSCSTRTTHPNFINLLIEMLNSLGIDNPIDNPYKFTTKGEMIENCKNNQLLKLIYLDSCSCAKRGHKKYWINKNARHCGLCLPCIYRRVSLHFNSWDGEGEEKYGKDIFNPSFFRINDFHKKSTNDLRALLYLIRDNLQINDIKKQLIVNGLNDMGYLNEYALLVKRTLDQVKEWINEKGTHEMKKMAGLI